MCLEKNEFLLYGIWFICLFVCLWYQFTHSVLFIGTLNSFVIRVLMDRQDHLRDIAVWLYHFAVILFSPFPLFHLLMRAHGLLCLDSLLEFSVCQSQNLLYASNNAYRDSFWLRQAILNDNNVQLEIKLQSQMELWRKGEHAPARHCLCTPLPGVLDSWHHVCLWMLSLSSALCLSCFLL